MQQQPPRQRAPAAPQAIGASTEAKNGKEEAVLEALLGALARGGVAADAWDALHATARADDRVSELALAFESVGQGKRLRTVPPPAAAEFSYQAGRFFADVRGDGAAAVAAFERALALAPGHGPSLERLDDLLQRTGDLRKRAEIHAMVAQHRPRAEQAPLLRRATELMVAAGVADERLAEWLQLLLRLEPGDERARTLLEQWLLAANRYRDAIRLNEQALAAEPAPEGATRLAILARIVELYADRLQEPERALPYIEQLLALDPSHEAARRVAHKLVSIRGLAGRAAAALATAYEALGSVQEVAHFLSVELESTRGPKRASLLARLGRWKHDRMGDAPGAFEVYEQALFIDPDDDVRARYVRLAADLQRTADGAKTLARLLSAAKDPATRARTSAQLGELLVRSGDSKRALPLLQAVVAAADAPPDAVLAAGYLLRELLEGGKDPRPLCDVLERVALVEPDLEKRREVDEKLAEIARRLADVPRAIAAYERLLSTTGRSKALEALAPLYEASGDPARHARLLEERAKDATDPAEARRLLMRAAEVLAKNDVDPAAAVTLGKSILARFGPARDVVSLLVPLLEAQRRWGDLAEALEGEAALAEGAARAQVLGRVATLRLHRLHDAEGAIRALEAALEVEPADASARTMLERLAAAGDKRLDAARVLEPIYRREGARLPLLRLLEVRGALAPDSDERLTALREAAAIAVDAGAAEAPRALEVVARGLALAATAGRPIGEWLARLEEAIEPAPDPGRRAAILSAALVDCPIDTPDRSALACRAAEALAAAGDPAAAVALYRRALAFDPQSPELLGRIDALLRDQGSPEERIALYRSAIEQAAGPRRRDLRHRIGAIQRHDLGDVAGAIVTFRAALEEDALDAEAQTALEELYGAAGLGEELCRLLEDRVGQVDGDAARAVRARVCDVAAAHGDRDRVVAHAAVLLDDADLEPELLGVVQRAAEKVDAVDVVRAALRRRAEAGDDPRGAVAALDALGQLELERRGDPEGAALAWKRAAQLAEAGGDTPDAVRLYSRARRLAPEDRDMTARLAELCDRSGLWSELPALLTSLAQSSDDDDERVRLTLATARVLSERLGDTAAAAHHAARAFELAPARRDVVAAFEALSVAAGALAGLEAAIANVLEDPARPLDADDRAYLALTRARALASDPSRRADAKRAYRALAEADPVPERRAAALEAFERLVAADGDSPDARADHEWLFGWRAENGPESQRTASLLEWARVEERRFGDPRRALDLYKRALALDPRSEEAIAMIARLALVMGSTEEALEALRARRDRAEGEARVAVDREIATVLVRRTDRNQEALGVLEGVLSIDPGDAEAHQLATELASKDRARTAAVALLERVCEQNDDPGVEESILTRLLDLPVASSDPDARCRWLERLTNLKRRAGRPREALAYAFRAARQAPDRTRIWERAEELARELGVAEDVAALYEEILARPLASDAAIELGRRAVQFYEEWFDDPPRIVRVLERVLELEPQAEWAFERLKLSLDAAERWDELFALYDRALASADPARRAALLEEAAQTAKDFADRPDRAIGYLQQLFALRPRDPKLSSALERLYERRERFRDLIALLEGRLAGAGEEEVRRTRLRIAALWLERQRDPGAALEAIEPLLGDGGPAGDAPAPAWHLVERVLEAEDRADPPAARARAARWLRDRYAALGRDEDLARVLLVEIETMADGGDRARAHAHVSHLYERIGDLDRALDQIGEAVVLAPDDDGLRARLVEVAGRTGDYAALARRLAEAGATATDPSRRAALAIESARVHVDRLADASAATALLAAILADPEAREVDALTAARLLEPLLERAGCRTERLDVLERIAAAEPDRGARRAALGEAARLATGLGENARALASWERALAADPGDAEALDAAVDLLAREARHDRLAQVLDLRALATDDPERRRADRVRGADLVAGALGQPEEAIARWRAIEAEFGFAEDVAAALADLLRSTGRWGELEHLLQQALGHTDDPLVRIERWADLGDVRRTALGDGPGAVHAYAAAVQANPAHDRARSGLQALAASEAPSPEAVGVLLDALRATDDWRSILELTAPRVATADSADARIRVLAEAAQLWESRAGEPRRAFDVMRQAFALAPGDAGLARELGRLAEAGALWAELAETYRDALAAVGPHDGPLRARLGSTLGEVLQHRLGDRAAALDAYLDVVASAPEPAAVRAALRVAGLLGRWDVAARVVVGLGRGGHPALSDGLEALGEAAREGSAWDAAARALEPAAADGALPDAAARDIYAQLAAWHRDRRHDPEAAQIALDRALQADPGNVDLLRASVDLQRSRPGRGLVDALVALARATGGSPSLLRDACEAARDAVRDPALVLAIARQMLDVIARGPDPVDGGAAGVRLGGEEGSPAGSTGGTADRAALAQWAIEAIAQVHDDAGDARALVEALLPADPLPLPADVRRSMKRRAARVALERAGDVERAVALYAALSEEDPGDRESAERLAVIYVEQGRASDLLGLRERQIASASDPALRAALRLDATRLLVELGQPARAVDLLRETLRERPDEPATVDMLAEVLEAGQRFRELHDVLVEHAERASAQAADDPTLAARAADAWSRAAQIAAEGLHDPDLAAAYHERVVALVPRPRSLAALADLAERRSDFAGAAGWLERWAEVADVAQFTDVILRLSEALANAGEPVRAAERVRAVIPRALDPEPLRVRLAVLHRQASDWPKLAEVLSEAAGHAPTKSARLERLVEAARLFIERCGAPARAGPLLEEATELAPDDVSIKLMLADALVGAGRHGEARSMLQARIDAFGGRRPRERAPMHYRLAQIDLASGDRARALVELDAAARVDPQNTQILRALAALARDDGQLERAEKSYRALLVALRRQADTSGGDEEPAIARSEVLLELSELAAGRGETERSREIFESALETASESDFEQDRLEAALRARHADERLVRVLERRLARLDASGASAAAAARCAGELATLLELRLGRPEEALAARMRALSLDPSAPETHDAALASARAAGRVPRYAEAIEALIARARDAGDGALAADLLGRLGQVAEGDLHDDARAVASYKEAAALDPTSPSRLGALDRLYERLGDKDGAADALLRRIRLEQASGDRGALADALYRLAALRLSTAATLEDGVRSLRAALDVEPRFDVAEQAMRPALAIDPGHAELLDLYEEIGRQPGREKLLVDALRLRARAPAASLDAVREAVSVAVATGQNDVAEELLERFVHGGSEADPAAQSWALATAAALREQAGDLAAAAALKRRAADAAGPDRPDEARRLLLEAARLATGALGDLDLAAATYRALHEADPADRSVWEALANVYRDKGDAPALVGLLGSVIATLDDPKQRASLRLERAAAMAALGAGDDDTARELRAALEEDPSHAAGALMLADILERQGASDELAALLSSQIDAAKDREDATAVASFALRLGRLLGRTDPASARPLYYMGLDWRPNDPALLDALLATLAGDDDAVERADLLERRLAVETGPAAEAVALDLAAARTQQGAERAAERALALGFRAYPRSTRLRSRLEEIYRRRGDWRALADLCVADALVRDDPGDRIARLREAAGLRRDEVGDPRGAAEALQLAHREAPEDTEILAELVDALLRAGDALDAVPPLDAAIAALPADDARRAPLLAARAAVCSALGDEAAANDNLEAAFGLDPERYAAPLAAQLELALASARSTGDASTHRSIELRRAQVLPFAGDSDAARAILADLVRRDPNDRDALRTLASLESALENWATASAAWARLCRLEEGEDGAEAALALAEAAERAGRPADARDALERMHRAMPEHRAVRERLDQLYEAVGAWREQAELSLADAKTTVEVSDRVAYLLRAGWLLYVRGGDAAGAIAALEEALALRPRDVETVALLADAYTALGRAHEALAVLEPVIAAQRGRRTRDLALLHLRAGRAARELEDATGEIRALAQALECDSQNGEVCAEVGVRAVALGQFDLATRALRAVTLLKAPGPMSKALAYQYLGEIAQTQGDPKRALTLLRRALTEDPSLATARALAEAIERGP